jgi:hypothetical protein
MTFVPSPSPILLAPQPSARLPLKTIGELCEKPAVTRAFPLGRSRFARVRDGVPLHPVTRIRPRPNRTNGSLKTWQPPEPNRSLCAVLRVSVVRDFVIPARECIIHERH